MELNASNFFSHLIFHPLDVKTNTDKFITIVATVACWIFSLGICPAVCAIRNCITYVPSKEASDRDKKISEIKNQALTISISSYAADHELPQVHTKTLSLKVTKVLRELFEGSANTLEDLPNYPIVIDEKHGFPKRSVMSAPIMVGISIDNRPFIAIKVDCDLTEDNIKHYDESTKTHYRNNKRLKKLLVLYQTNRSEFSWDQQPNNSFEPYFFNYSFMDEKNESGLAFGQRNNYISLQTLFKTGSSQDLNGLIWRIPQK